MMWWMVATFVAGFYLGVIGMALMQMAHETSESVRGR
jgi:hypothetical protein